MDYESINNFIQSPEGQLTIYSSVAVISAGMGSLLGKKSSKRYNLEKELQLSEQLTRREQIDLEKIKAQNEIEGRKIDYENADNKHKRELERMAKEREYKLEDQEKTYKIKLENDRIFQEKIEKENQHELELANKLAELKPVLEKYLIDGVENRDYLQKRQELREELVEEILKDCRDREGIAQQIVYEENEIIDEDAQGRIENIVIAKYPLDEIPMPSGLKKLIDLLFEEFED